MEWMYLKPFYPPFYDDTKQDQVYCSYVENLEFSPHFHEQVELLYVIDGEIEVSVSGMTRRLKRKELSIAFPQKIHAYQTTHRSTVNLIIFPIDLLNDFYHMFREKQPIYPFISCDKITGAFISCIQFLFEYITVLDADFVQRRYYTIQKANELRMAKGYLQILLCHMVALLDMKESETGAEENSVLKCIRYVTDHYRDPIQLADIARYAGISRVQVSRIFAKKIGYTFPEYLNTLRLNYAAHLLETTGRCVLDICGEAGFESVSTFYSYFQKKYQMTPKAFRGLSKQV